jgi:hypothetical protein
MRRNGAFAGLFAGCLLGCNLVVTLDDLQDGAGAGSGTGSAPTGGPGASNGSTATTSTGSGATTATMTTTGAGGSTPAYEACVASLGPVVRLRLDAAAEASEPNLGSWGGMATGTGTRTAEQPLVDGSVGATSFAPDGTLTLSAPPFFGTDGGYQAFSIELWFRAPPTYSEDVFLLQAGMALLFLRIEERQDPMGLDSIRFRFIDPINDRGVIANVDLADGATHHLVAVYRQTAQTTFVSGTADDLVIYLDGNPSPNLATGTETPMPQIDGPLVFGGGFGGPIDELALYPIELSATTVAALTALGQGETVECPAQ